MDTKKLTLELTNAVQRILGSDYSVSTSDVTKNNSLVLTGLIIKKEGQNICPTIYINELFDSYKAGVSVDVLAEEIIRLYRKNDVSFTFDASVVADYKKAKDKIIFQIINTECNADLLERIPSVKFLDLSIIFKIYLDNFPLGSATATVTNKMLDEWKVSIETVYKAAMTNTPVLQEYLLKNMADMLVELGMDIGIDSDMAKSTGTDILYVLSNRQHACGSGCILYPHVLEDFAERIGRGFYILPSSRHEVLFTPEYEKDTDALLQIVREVNRTALEQEDFLSDNVYYYSKETKEITIIQ